MYCKCHGVIFVRSASYIDSPDWIKKKKAAINTDTKYFKKAATVSLNYEIIESHPE